MIIYEVIEKVGENKMKKYFINILMLSLVAFLPISSYSIKADELTLEEVALKIGFQQVSDLKTDMIIDVTRINEKDQSSEVVLSGKTLPAKDLRTSKYTFTNDDFALTEGKYRVDISFPDRNEDGTLNLANHYVDQTSLHNSFYIRKDVTTGKLYSENTEIRFYNNPIFFGLNVSGQVSIDDAPVEDIEGIEFTIVTRGLYKKFEEEIKANPSIAKALALNYTRVSKKTGAYNIQDMMFSDNPYKEFYVVVTELPEGMTEDDMGLDFKWIRELHFNDIVDAPKGKRLIARQPINHLYTQEVNVKVVDEKTNLPVVANLSVSGGDYYPVNKAEITDQMNLSLFSGKYDISANTLDYEVSKVEFDGVEIDKNNFELQNTTLSTGPKEIVIFVKNTTKDPEVPVKPVDPVNPVDPVDPVTPIDPVVPVEPVTPIDPVNPEKSGETESVVVPSDTNTSLNKGQSILPNTGVSNMMIYASITLIAVGTILLFKKKKSN